MRCPSDIGVRVAITTDHARDGLEATFAKYGVYYAARMKAFLETVLY